MKTFLLDASTYVPLGVLGVFVGMGLWMGRIETKLEAHQRWIDDRPAAVERADKKLEAVAHDVAGAREDLAKFRGAWEVQTRVLEKLLEERR